jgi:type IV pilus assembly protein PilB
MRVPRLGELLVARGVLTDHQVQTIAEHQVRSARPFGVLAEELFGVDPRAIEGAWAEQYESMAPTLTLAPGEPTAEAIDAVTRRRAKQFGVAPIRFERGQLTLATTRENLPRALLFGLRVLERPCTFVIAPSNLIEAIIDLRYASGEAA